VQAGVLVVRLDHVAEQHRGPPVSRAERERIVHPLLSLASEEPEHRHRREREQH
jgi:hypothetical protein